MSSNFYVSNNVCYFCKSVKDYELQKLKSFEGCALGGGTNLAILYGHRRSTDIDLFFPHIIGKAGYESIKNEVSDFYGNSVFGTQYPCDIDDQFIFLRFFLSYVTEKQSKLKFCKI